MQSMVTCPVFLDIFPTGAALKAVWYGAETFGKLIAMGRPASAAGESSGSSVPVSFAENEHPYKMYKMYHRSESPEDTKV